MMRDRYRHNAPSLAAVMVSLALLAVAPAASAGDGSAARGPDGGFSLRHIPEALPLTDGGVSLHRAESDWYGQGELEDEDDLSITKAVLYSLLLPGLGDWYAGKKDRAKAFFIVDAALWSTFIVFQVQGHRREDSYQDYARTFAGVASTGHSDDYYSLIGQFNSSSEYESDFKKESRLDLWPDVGYDALETYYVQNRVSDFEEWQWRSFDDRVDYRELRSSSKVAYRRSGYMLAAAALNRVVASIFAYQAVKSRRGETAEDTGAVSQHGGYRLDISSPANGRRGGFSAAVSLIRSF